MEKNVFKTLSREEKREAKERYMMILAGVRPKQKASSQRVIIGVRELRKRPLNIYTAGRAFEKYCTGLWEVGPIRPFFYFKTCFKLLNEKEKWKKN